MEQYDCRWEDLDPAAGVCTRCGEAFFEAPDPVLAVEAHYDR